MNTFTIATTVSISEDNSLLFTAQAGDIIHTKGYYDEDDKNGATFTVRAREANEYMDSVVRYPLRNNLTAEFLCNSDSVRIEQLGAVHHGMPIESTFLDGNPEGTAEKNSDVFYYALNSADCSKIILSQNAVYDFLSAYIYNKRLTIDGNGATLQQVSTTITPCLQIVSSPRIVIRNLKLISMCTGNSIAGVYSYRSKVHLHNVHIVSDRMGLHIAGSSAYNRICAQNVCIQAGSVGIQCEDTKFAEFRNVKIDASGTGFVTYGESENLRCRHVCIRNASTGMDIHAMNACLLSDISLFNVNKAFNFTSVTGAVLSDFCATQVKKGFSFSNCNNISITKGFVRSQNRSGANSSDLLLDASQKSHHILFADCSFDFATRWFSVNNTTSNQADLSFLHCRFCARETPEATPYPAIIQRGTVNASFCDCTFYVKSFPWLTGTPGSVSPNAAMFYFKTTTRNTPVYTWAFEHCRFLHDSADNETQRVTVNSPFWVDDAFWDSTAEQYSHYEKTHILLTGCSLHDFRWTIRLFSDGAPINIDPAQSGFPTDTVIATAAAGLTGENRFFSHQNQYDYSDIPAGYTGYRRDAEEYGISQ